MVVEGGGATGLAALLPGAQIDRQELKGKNIVIPLCGGNIDTTVLGRGELTFDKDPLINVVRKSQIDITLPTPVTLVTPVLERGLAADNRLKALVATVSDRPGGIARLTTLLGNNGASIKDIYHERAFLHANIDHVRVKVVIELQGKDHAQKIEQVLIQDGYNPVWDDDGDKKMI